jgi:hypothetical protein
MAKDATAVAADALSASRGASSITKGNRPLHVVEGLRKANCHPLRFFFRFFFGWPSSREKTSGVEIQASSFFRRLR